QLDVRGCPNLEALEVDENCVALLIVGDPLGQAQAEQQLLQPHGLGLENERVHEAWVPHDRAEAHVWQDVPLRIDPVGNLHELDTLCGPRDHAALYHVVDSLSTLSRIAPAERDLLDALDEFLRSTLSGNTELAIFDPDFEPTSRESTRKQ